MKDLEKLAVVICNHNKGKSTVDCIASVLASGQPEAGSSLKIFVIDNASDDDSLAVITGAYEKQISLIRCWVFRCFF